jgi:hypothetical protein
LKKPINIIFEIVFLIILMIGGGFYTISSKHETSWLFALVLVVYTIGIISITLRTSLYKQGERRAMSTFLFGLACGGCYGVLLSLILPEAANLNIVMIASGILVWGIAGGLIAVFSSYIISLSFIKVLYRSFFPRDHEDH